MNIAIMRAFNRLRKAVSLHTELARRIGELELKYEGLEHRYDGQFARVFDALRINRIVLENIHWAAQSLAQRWGPYRPAQ